MKKCRVCTLPFIQYRALQAVCSPRCALKDARAKAEKKQRQQLAVRKQALKTLGEHKKELQTIYNKFIRLRDADLPCISCQRYHQGQYHCGHYLTVGAHPNLRYDENNTNKQCAPCNNHLSGNIINYRINLINKIGVEAVESLESDNTPKHYKISDILLMKSEYKAKIKQLEKGIL